MKHYKRFSFQTILSILIPIYVCIGQSNTEENEAEEITANKCAQFCSCAPNTPMPNGWNGRSTSVGRWEGCSPNSLMYWPLSVLPTNIKIDSARMELYCTSSWGQAEGNVAFAPVMESWDQAVTYNNHPRIDTAKAIIAEWPQPGEWLNVDITSVVRNWYEEILPNYGLDAYSTTLHYNGGVDFRSPGWPTNRFHPKLTILYTNKVSVENNKSEMILKSFTLSQNHPNPFNPLTKIEYNLKKPSKVRIEIYNSQGQLIKTLVNQFQCKGDYIITWDGTNCCGKQVSSGIYLYSITTQDHKEQKTMGLVR